MPSHHDQEECSSINIGVITDPNMNAPLWIDRDTKSGTETDQSLSRAVTELGLKVRVKPCPM